MLGRHSADAQRPLPTSQWHQLRVWSWALGTTEPPGMGRTTTPNIPQLEPGCLASGSCSSVAPRHPPQVFLLTQSEEDRKQQQPSARHSSLSGPKRRETDPQGCPLPQFLPVGAPIIQSINCHPILLLSSPSSPRFRLIGSLGLKSHPRSSVTMCFTIPAAEHTSCQSAIRTHPFSQPGGSSSPFWATIVWEFQAPPLQRPIGCCWCLFCL